jgi:hypothetical protein
MGQKKNLLLDLTFRGYDDEALSSLLAGFSDTLQLLSFCQIRLHLHL